MKHLLTTALGLALCPIASADVRGAVMAHNTPIFEDETAHREDGPDIMGEASTGLVYGAVSANTAGGTSFAAVGLEHRFGDRLFVRPGAGIAVHDGDLDGPAGSLRLGSRVLCDARIDVGLAFGGMEVAFRVEHLSNGPFGGVNNGMDNAGIVLAWRG